MCGFVGVWNLNGQPVDVARLVVATRTLRHRGPDDEGFLLIDSRTGRRVACKGSETNPGVDLPRIEDVARDGYDLAFGHRRLAILDLSVAGHQPLVDEASGDAFVFNGEIYNHRDLAEELSSAGEVLTGRCDTEVLFKALHRWGVEEAVPRLDGMFAFAYWDARSKRLLCARDRFGEKPLVYSHEQGRSFLVASEMKALFPFVGVPSLNAPVFTEFLANGRVASGDQTFFESLHRIPPAHRLAIDRNGTRVSRYWDLDLTRHDRRPDRELIGEFRQRLSDSVKHRMHADVPLGSSLSGGLDSSSVVCLLNRWAGSGQSTFTARFSGPLDEGAYARMVVERTEAAGSEVWPAAGGFLEELDSCLWHQEEPFPTGSIYAQWKVMELAKQGDVTVLLDGQGADETLAGYPMYFSPYHAELLRHGAWGTLRTQRLRFRQQLHRSPPSLGMIAGYAFVPAGLRPKVRNLALRFGRTAGSPASPVLLPPDSSTRVPHHLMKESGRSLSGSLRASLGAGNGLQSLLRYADMNSMAHSREVRLPFLDHTLVEFAFSLPNHLKIDGGLGKVALRESMRGIIPDLIRERTDKIGYEPPQRDWLEEEDVMSWVRTGTKHLVADGWLLPPAGDIIHDDSPGSWRGLTFRLGIAGAWLQAVDRWRDHVFTGDAADINGAV